MRAVIYARFSSENQSERSIDDQARVCQEYAESNGFIVTKVYSDYAISGTIMDRPQLTSLLKAAREGQSEIVLCHALDRLSRDPEHLARIFKNLKFAGVKLVTVTDGSVSLLQVGFNGTMSAQFMETLKANTHRGLEGRVLSGNSGGGLAYGYDVIRTFGSKGEAVRGGRAINLVQAEIVVRIFALFVAGIGPDATAKLLNEEKIAGPAGEAWQGTTIRGHAKRGTGILHNELYIGQLVWNRMHYLRHPDTDKRVARMNPPEKWVRSAVPHLRIIDDALWEKAQAKLRECSRKARHVAPPACTQPGVRSMSSRA